MGVLKIKEKGNYEKTKSFLNKAMKQEYLNFLDAFGRKGVAILQNATPKDTGVTANSWNYVIDRNKNRTTISWINDSVVENSRGYKFNIVILLQYGHATRNGGWVEGYNFVDDSMRPLFDEMANKAWEELIKN